MNKKSKKGTVYLVGGGPGDPQLITLKGARLLASADAVIYDYLINPELLRLASRAEKIYVGKNIHSKNTSEYISQEKIHQLLEKLSHKYKRIVRLKGGDPWIFSRGSEEASFLKKKKIPFEVVPGVSAGIAVPAYAGIPITDRRYASAATFVTAHQDPNNPASQVNWKALGSTKGTLVIFMGAQRLKEIVKQLMAGGMTKKMPISVIEWGTTAKQRIVDGTLDNIVTRVARKGLTSPCLSVIGQVNQLRKTLSWFQPQKSQRKLSGKTILVTRPQGQSLELREKLEEEGAHVLEMPSIEILPPKSWKAFDDQVRQIQSFDWMIFTSIHGVHAVFNRLQELGKDARVLSHLKIAAIGPTTADHLRHFGILADLIPAQFTSEGLIKKLNQERAVQGKRFLLVRTDIAPPYLTQALSENGASYKEVTVYRTVKPKSVENQKVIAESLRNGKVDYVTFTSASTVDHFFQMIPPKRQNPSKARFISIGPITSQALKKWGFRPYREAKEHTLSGLIQTLT